MWKYGNSNYLYLISRDLQYLI